MLVVTRYGGPACARRERVCQRHHHSAGPKRWMGGEEQHVGAYYDIAGEFGDNGTDRPRLFNAEAVNSERPTEQGVGAVGNLEGLH